MGQKAPFMQDCHKSQNIDNNIQGRKHLRNTNPANYGQCSIIKGREAVFLCINRSKST